MWDRDGDKPAGDIRIQVTDQHASLFPRDMSAALVEQRLTPVVKYAAWVPMSAAMLEDARGFGDMMAEAADRALRPWRYPDRPKIGSFDLFPRVTSARQAAGRVRHAATEAHDRVNAAWRTLRHGRPESDTW